AVRRNIGLSSWRLVIAGESMRGSGEFLTKRVRGAKYRVPDRIRAPKRKMPGFSDLVLPVWRRSGWLRGHGTKPPAVLGRQSLNGVGGFSTLTAQCCKRKFQTVVYVRHRFVCAG